MSDMTQIRHELIRWQLLLALNNAREADGAGEALLLAIIQADHPDATAVELRRELDYLAERCLIRIVKAPNGKWTADINRHGIDMVEYTIDCEPGIARPKKYW